MAAISCLDQHSKRCRRWREGAQGRRRRPRRDWLTGRSRDVADSSTDYGKAVGCPCRIAVTNASPRPPHHSRRSSPIHNRLNPRHSHPILRRRTPSRPVSLRIILNRTIGTVRSLPSSLSTSADDGSISHESSSVSTDSLERIARSYPGTDRPSALRSGRKCCSFSFAFSCAPLCRRVHSLFLYIITIFLFSNLMYIPTYIVSIYWSFDCVYQTH